MADRNGGKAEPLGQSPAPSNLVSLPRSSTLTTKTLARSRLGKNMESPIGKSGQSAHLSLQQGEMQAPTIGAVSRSALTIAVEPCPAAPMARAASPMV
jgi:hypothetical protein